MSGAYPNHIGPRAGSGGPRDLQGAPTNDNEAKNTRPPNETFRRDRAIRTIGRRAAGKLIERAAERLVTPKFPILKIVDAAVTAYDIYSYTVAGGGDPLPRDPNNADDMAISVPAGWRQTFNNIADKGEPITSGINNWYRNTPFPRPGVHDYNTVYGTTEADIIQRGWGTKSSAEEITSLPLPATNVTFQRYRRFEDDFGDLGTYEVENIWRVTGDELPTWANPPRTAPGGGVVTRVVPRANSPRRRWADLPNQPRTRYSETGEPSASPRPRSQPVGDLVPPPVVIGGPSPSSRPGSGQPAPTTRPNQGVQPRRREPPGPGVKERKAKIKSKGLAMFIGAIEVVPELLDTVNALWKALPKSCKSGYYKLHGKGGREFYKRRFRASQAQRIGDLKRCWLHMDLQTALESIVSNQLEDAWYGRFGKMQAVAGNKLNMNKGLGFGSWDTFTNKMLHEAGYETESLLPDFGDLVTNVTRNTWNPFSRG